jgi:pimeloyl-ACP methyl ester carboxylesterase
MNPTRIFTLTLVAVAIAGIAAFGLVRGDDPPKVPKDARAGQLSLKPCTYTTEAGPRAADCGTMVVRENRRDPQSQLIAIPVTRIKARSAHPAEPIFRLEGGPGITNMKFPMASRFADDHDVVLVGYRGVDSSTRLDCPEVVSARLAARDMLSEGAMRASATALRDCADRLTAEGHDLDGYTIPQRVDDLEDARRLLHYGKVNLFSESAGTRAAQIYSWRYPASIHRSVQLAVNAPGRFLYRPEVTDTQLEGLCGGDCPTRLGEVPKRWGPFPIEPGNVRTVSFFGLMESSSAAAPLTAPMTLDSWRAAADGDASGLWFQSVMGRLVFPRVQVWGEHAATARLDAAAAKRYFAAPTRDRSGVGDALNRFGWADGRLIDAWPSTPDDNAYATPRTSRIETLLISGEVDGATPAVNATKDVLPHLPNGHQVILKGFGHTTDFWNNQEPAGAHLVNTFLATGTVDDSRFVEQKIDLTPDTTQTGTAKKLAGAMIGLALIAALSLALAAFRVRRNRQLGRVASVAMRSVWGLVLGLGGWFGAALLALILDPSLQIDSAAVVVPSVAIPVGLGAYLAWIDHDRPKLAGLACAFAGAQLGALFGFAVAASPMTLLTAIVGAVAGTNLLLVVGDIVADRRVSAPAR